MMILLFIYDAFSLAVIAGYCMISLARKKLTLLALRQKLFIIPGLKKTLRPSLWIQAVSVGEVSTLKNFVDFLKKNTAYRIVVSTTTLTGFTVAKKLYSGYADVIFFPFDVTFILHRAINFIHPVLFIALETEIWPNLFYQLRRRACPVMILNGRISDRAYRRYRKVRFITRSVLKNCACIGVQTEQYRQRFLALGAERQKTFIGGNMKFDSLSLDAAASENFRQRYENVLKKEEGYLLIAASTHNPEEEIILEVYKRLSASFNVRLLLAPRHPRRARDLERMITSRGFRPVLMSQDFSGSRGEKPVFILDTVGELFYAYGICDVCFVGGSLVNYGGHNILEPMYLGKPTLFGPYMSNFQEIKDKALAFEAALMVRDSSSIYSAVHALFSDASLRSRLSANCRRVFSAEKEILAKNTDAVMRLLKAAEE